MNEQARRWTERHAYLKGVAGFHDAVETAAAAAALPQVAVPAGAAWLDDLAGGIPLLRSPKAGLAASPALPDALGKLVAALAAAPVPEAISGKAALLRDSLGTPDARARAVAWLLTGAGDAPIEAGLARFVGWFALAHALAPAIEAAGLAREDGRWPHGTCPTCAAAPIMAQLVEQGDGRKRRLLVCGQCRTRWSHKRIGCPHCENEDASTLALLEVEGDPGLRLDVCEVCKGYVKSVSGAPEEELLLTDWPTLHLDVLAAERGYVRKGASLYELGE
jgi:FdhE protein